MPLITNIIGAGRLGKTIGKLLLKSKLIKIQAICNRTFASTLEAITFFGEGEQCLTIKQLPAADITFITTPDDLIEKTAKELALSESIKLGSTIVHCSGSLTSKSLKPLQDIGCFVASVHPMRSFANTSVNIEEYEGTYCAMEGDKEAIVILDKLFKAIGSITYLIEKNKKGLYHAAGVFASNYLVTLADCALQCLNEAKVKKEIAMKVITSLMKGTVSNLERTLSPEHSLTGPIKRGDSFTIEKHLASFSSPLQRELYEKLGIATIDLTKHSLEIKNLLNSILSNEKDHA